MAIPEFQCTLSRKRDLVPAVAKSEIFSLQTQLSLMTKAVGLTEANTRSSHSTQQVLD